MGSGLLRDFRYGLRQLVRTPAFTLPAVVSLALGIAVNSAMFSVLNAILLRPFEGGGPELVRIGRSMRSDGSFRSSTREELLYLQRYSTTLTDVFGESLETFTVSGSQAAEIASGEIASGNYFSALRVPFALGRGFSVDQDRGPVQGAEVVISERYWRREFASSNSIIGQVVRINTRPFTIVGVTPPQFHGTFPGVDIDLWIPSAMVGATRVISDATDELSLQLMGRLRPGQSISSAQAELSALSAQLNREDPGRDRDRGFVVRTARGAHPAIAGAVGTFLVMLMGIVGVVLLIACSNVGSLFLARAIARRAEFAIRLSLGAGRGRLLSQLITESLTLALGAAALGLLLAGLLIRVVNAMALSSGPTGLSLALNLSLDPRVLAFTAAVSVLSAVLFGLGPARQALRVDVVSALKETRSLAGRRRARLRGLLLIGQIALSGALIVTSMLLSSGLRHAASLEPGFNPNQVVLASFNPQLPGYDRARVDAFFTELLDRTRRLVTVEHAALAASVPMSLGGAPKAAIRLPGATESGRELPSVYFNRVSDQYFATIEQPIVSGRDFQASDQRTSPRVVIVNQVMAQRFWPNRNAVGQRVRLDDEDADREVVGIVQDTRVSLAKERLPLMYVPVSQRPSTSLTLHVRSTAAGSNVVRAIRELAAEVDPQVAVTEVKSMRETMAGSLFPAEVARSVFGLAGFVAFVLAACGLYGLVSYLGAQREKEIGIRVALGANAGQVVREIAGGASSLAMLGLVVGLGLGSLAARLLAALVPDLNPADVSTLAPAGLGLLLISIAAAVAASRKSLKVDPIVALRND